MKRNRFIRKAAIAAVAVGASYTNAVAAPQRNIPREPRAYEGLYYMIFGCRKAVSGPEEKRMLELAGFRFCR